MFDEPVAATGVPDHRQTRAMPVCAQCGTENPDVAKFCLACGSAARSAAAPPQEFRKIVTIVFSDLKGSTSMGEKLDSESLREVMTRYFDTMRAELEQHGGVVEKFIGDAIMAVFGLPKLHEDDALRAVRAAAGMQRALAELNDELERHWGVRLTVRTGVNTGEVVAGDPDSRAAPRDRGRRQRRRAPRAGRRGAGGAPRRPHVPPRPRLRRRRGRRAARAQGQGRARTGIPARLRCARTRRRPRRLDAPMVGRDSELGTAPRKRSRRRRPRRSRDS